MRLWPLCLVLSGCASCGPPVIAGQVELAIDGLDPTAFVTLELRGYATYDRGEPADVEPAYRDSIPIADVRRFPYEFLLEEQRTSGYVVFLHAWLARDPKAPAAAVGEPFGKTVAELCECATEQAAFADDVVVVIDSITSDPRR